MATAVQAPLVSCTEYLERERRAEFKSEYHSGRIEAMAGAGRVHALITLNVAASLHDQLRDRPCRVYAADLRVSVRGGDCHFYPDVVVAPGEDRFEDNVIDTLTNPVVVVEVLSPSTEGYDRGDKFLEYQSIPTLREYVLVCQTARRLEVFRRRAEGDWAYQSIPFAAPPLVLESVGCTLTFDDVYFKVDLPAGPAPDKDPHIP